jgi:hypothetical protein
MAVLTKVRFPVSAISQIANGTSKVDIASSGADVITTVSGNTIATAQTTGLLINAVKVLTAKQITSEVISLSTAAGASATVGTTGTKGQVAVTSAHPLDLIANAISGLLIGTDGKVTLGVQGTSAAHLVNKSYVDAAASSASATTATVASNGTISIPNSSGTNLVVKWGTQAGSGVLTQVTFGVAFPNAIYVALAIPTHNSTANSDGWFGVYNKQLTGFQINQANRASSTYSWNWIAIGS